MKAYKDFFFQLQEMAYFQQKIGITGFEPATSRPPAVRSDQTEPYPVNHMHYHMILYCSTYISKMLSYFEKVTFERLIQGSS